MHMLVTGGCGFIGSHLADRLLAEGHAVTLLDDLSTGDRANAPAGATLVEGNVADAALVAQLAAGVQAVFHLAAVASVQVCETQPALAERTNIGGTRAVFAAVAKTRVPVVYASSAAIYGDNHDLPLHEAALPAPLGAYGRHKLENERLAARHAGPSTGLRFFNVYGPRQDARSPYSGVISKFAAGARAGEPLTFFGDGGQTRDFIYVGDIVELLLAAWRKVGPAAVYNGCTGQATSLRQLADAVGVAVGRMPETRHEPARMGDIRHSLGDPALAHGRLGFRAATPLDTGLRALIGGAHV